MNILHTLWNLACTIAANFKFILGKGAPYRAPFFCFSPFYDQIPDKGEPNPT